jgi:hypothetical protein
MHVDEYRELLKRERAHDEQTGKKWIDIDGATAASNVGTQPITAVKHEPNNERAYKSNDGGEA